MAASHTAPLFDPQRDPDPAIFPVHIARHVARTILGECQSRNIHSHSEMMNAAVRLDGAMRQLLAALDAEAAEQQPQTPERAERPAELTPQPNRILAEPATVEACARDYAAGAAIRARMDKAAARRR